MSDTDDEIVEIPAPFGPPDGRNLIEAKHAKLDDPEVSIVPSSSSDRGLTSFQVTPGCLRCTGDYKGNVFICRVPIGHDECDKCVRDHKVCSFRKPTVSKPAAKAVAADTDVEENPRPKKRIAGE